MGQEELDKLCTLACSSNSAPECELQAVEWMKRLLKKIITQASSLKFDEFCFIISTASHFIGDFDQCDVVDSDENDHFLRLPKSQICLRRYIDANFNIPVVDFPPSYEIDLIEEGSPLNKSV